MKLISMTDFVIQAYEEEMDCNISAIRVFEYAHFLKQPLTLGMFVPCDDDGNVLEIPTKENSNNTIDHDSKLMDYNDAKSKVLFLIKSFEKKIIKSTSFFCYRLTFESGVVFNFELDINYTIEDLILYNLDLTVFF